MRCRGRGRSPGLGRRRPDAPAGSASSRCSPPRWCWRRHSGRPSACSARPDLPRLLPALAGAPAPAAQPLAAQPPAAEPALQTTLTQLRAEVAALKASVDATGRNAGAQYSKLVERFDRVERAKSGAGKSDAALPKEAVKEHGQGNHRLDRAAERGGGAPPPVPAPAIRDLARLGRARRLSRGRHAAEPRRRHGRGRARRRAAGPRPDRGDPSPGRTLGGGDLEGDDHVTAVRQVGMDLLNSLKEQAPKLRRWEKAT